MPDYSKGKIYKITSKNYNKIYIGSTCSTLEKRLYYHIDDMNRYIKQKKSSYYGTSYELCEEPDCKIELIKNYPCSSKQELCREEGRLQLINEDIIVNQQIAGRTKVEWAITEKGKAGKRKWNNKRIKCSICNKELCQGYLNKHKKRKHNINS